jgi:hypothetical protein
VKIKFTLARIDKKGRHCQTTSQRVLFSSPDRLEPLVDAPDEGRHDTLLELADEEGTDVT